MRTAIACWRGRIAPLFDTAGSVVVLEAVGGHDDPEEAVALPEDWPARVGRLREMGVERLVCGAISPFLRDLLDSAGIEVIAFVSGDVSDIDEALKRGGDLREEHPMPGCGRRCSMRGGSGRGTGGGGAAGAGRSRGFRGRSGGQGAPGVCRCPVCGYEQSHERGFPCGSIVCPACGVAMVRA